LYFAASDRAADSASTPAETINSKFNTSRRALERKARRA
jgi:hypothetical protein